jgi:hypothetical protein
VTPDPKSAHCVTRPSAGATIWPQSSPETGSLDRCRVSIVSPTPPSLSQEQRVAASRQAVANRRRRAQVKALIKSGDLSLEELFEVAEREECVAQMRAADLIGALPAVGEVKAKRIMRNAAIAESRRIRGLGPKQRAELFRALVR